MNSMQILDYIIKKKYKKKQNYLGLFQLNFLIQIN